MELLPLHGRGDGRAVPLVRQRRVVADAPLRAAGRVRRRHGASELAEISRLSRVRPRRGPLRALGAAARAPRGRRPRRALRAPGLLPLAHPDHAFHRRAGRRRPAAIPRRRDEAPRLARRNEPRFPHGRAAGVVPARRRRRARAAAAVLLRRRQGARAARRERVPRRVRFAARIFGKRVAATPRPRRGYSAGRRVAATPRPRRGTESRRSHAPGSRANTSRLIPSKPTA